MAWRTSARSDERLDGRPSGGPGDRPNHCSRKWEAGSAANPSRKKEFTKIRSPLPPLAVSEREI